MKPNESQELMKQSLIKSRSVLLALAMSGLPFVPTLAHGGSAVAKPLVAARAAAQAASSPAAEQAKVSPYAQANRRRLKSGEPHTVSLSHNLPRSTGQLPDGGQHQ